MQSTTDRAASSSSSSASPGDPHHHHHHNDHQMDPILTFLWIVTPTAATVSLLAVGIAMLTNQWLHTEEKMPNPAFNGTGQRDFLSKYTISGLWMFCYTNAGETLYECNNIDYFSKEEYNPDPNDSTLAIPYTMKRSAVFFLISTLLLSSGYCCFLLGQCSRSRTLCTFVSGVIFIMTGLMMLFALIVYISVFKSEIGGKLRPRSQLQPPAFTYWYGYSFLVFVGGLIAAQLAGISTLSLFIQHSQYKLKVLHCRRHHHHHHHQQTHMSKVPLPPPPPALITSSYTPEAATAGCRHHSNVAPQAYIATNSRILPIDASETPCIYHHQLSYVPSPCCLHDCIQASPPPTPLPPSTISSYRLDAVMGAPVLPPPPPPSTSSSYMSYQNNTMSRDATTNTVSTLVGGDSAAFCEQETVGDFIGYHLQAPPPPPPPPPPPLISTPNVFFHGPGGGGGGLSKGGCLEKTTPV